MTSLRSGCTTTWHATTTRWLAGLSARTRWSRSPAAARRMIDTPMSTTIRLTSMIRVGNSIPVNDFITEVMKFFQAMGYIIIGNPIDKSPNANGADMVAVLKQGETVIRVLTIELKDVSGQVNLGTLGKSSGRLTDYGGSIARVIRSAFRFEESSNQQLRIESETILKGKEAGNLQNVLVTTSKSVSSKAQDVFNGVYSNFKNSTAETIKALPGVATSLASAMKYLMNIPIIFMPQSMANPSNWSNKPSQTVQ